MAQPVNLNRYRKQKARANDTARATENAARFGRSKPRKEQQRLLTEKAARDLDGHKTDR